MIIQNPDLLTGNNGKLILNTTLVAGSLTVINATLQGTGIVSVPETTFGTNSVLRPGNSIGILGFVNGNVTFDSTSTLAIEIDPSASSRVDIEKGGATFNPGTTVSIIQTGSSSSYPPSAQYEILTTTGGITGPLPSVTGGLPNFHFSLFYLDNDLYLSYIHRSYISTTGLSGNAEKTANYLNKQAPESTLNLFEGLTGHALKHALDSVSPARNAFGNFITEQMAFSMSNLVSSHLDGVRLSRQPASSDKLTACLTADASNRVATPVKAQGSHSKFTGWVGGLAEYAHLEASDQNPGFNYLSEAVIVGLDYNPTNKDVVGGSIGYVHTHFRDDDHAGHGNINSYYAALYGNAFVGDLYFSPAVWGVYNQADQTRQIHFTGFKKQAHADISSWQFIPHLEIGYEIDQSWGAITPFTSADLAILWQEEFKEHGTSPFNAKQKANDSSMLRSETGLKFCEKWNYSWGAFLLKEKVSYAFEKPFGIGTVNTAFVGMPGAFTVTAVNQNLNLGTVGIDFLFAVGKKLPTKINFGYEGEFCGHFWSNELNLTISKDF